MCFTGVDTGYAVGGLTGSTNEANIIKTVNGGNTWVQQVPGITKELNSVYFTNVNIGYAVGYNGAILKTNDGGANWNLQSSGTTSSLQEIYFPNPSIGFSVGTNGKIIKTGGAITNVTNELVLNDGISIQPNPFTLHTTIDFKEDVKDAIIKIIDINGKNIRTLNYTGKLLQIKKEDLSNGLYFVQIILDQKTIITKKIIVQ